MVDLPILLPVAILMVGVVMVEEAPALGPHPEVIPTVPLQETLTVEVAMPHLQETHTVARPVWVLLPVAIPMEEDQVWGHLLAVTPTMAVGMELLRATMVLLLKAITVPLLKEAVMVEVVMVLLLKAIMVPLLKEAMAETMARHPLEIMVRPLNKAMDNPKLRIEQRQVVVTRRLF